MQDKYMEDQLFVQFICEMKEKMIKMDQQQLENIVDRLTNSKILIASDIYNLKKSDCLCIFKDLSKKYGVNFELMADSDYFGGIDKNR